jgi:hypothetical protein
MAKKRKDSSEEQQRQSRKEILIARRQERQTRQVRLAVGGVVALIAVVLLVGIVNEVVIKPTQPVATVNEVETSMAEWRNRVRFQRAQLIIGIEDLADALGQDIGQVQQFAGQQINLLLDPQSLCQAVLDQMIDEQLIQQGAETRGIFVSDADVQKEIEENFNFFGGSVPTALPTPTQTIMPTPSLTPIPTTVITEVIPTNTPFPSPTPGPTNTPLPTATAVSETAFQESLDETLSRLEDLGTQEGQFRDLIRAQLYRDRLIDALAEEEEVETEAEQASLFFVCYDIQNEADAAFESLNDSDFLTLWNTARSLPPDPDSENVTLASELIWRTADDIESLLGANVAESAFSLPIGERSAVLVDSADTEDTSDRYCLILVNGREIRPLTENAIRSAKEQILSSWLDGQRQIAVETFERWRTNVPQRPILDPRFLVAPTPTPVSIQIDTPTPAPE